MAKRANGEGSIGKYKNGWRSKINIGYDEDGKVIRKEFYGKTQKEVKEKLDEFRKNNLLDYNLDSDNLTLAQWFYIWLWEFKKREIKPNTFDSYHNVYNAIVEHEPKTDNSIRTIPLPNDILIRLREYKNEQNTKILKMGELYQKNDYVFADKA